jgi:hypothetical protein
MLEELVQELKKYPYVSEDIQVEYLSDPYNHVIIKNLLKQDIYDKLCARFYEYISRAPKPHGQIGSTNLTYNAFIYGLNEKDCVDGYEFFISNEWKEFVSKIFGIELNQHIAYSLHYHKAPSNNGYVHADLSLCSVINDPNRKIKVTGDCNYADDSQDLQPHVQKTMRTIAALYYFNNDVDNWKESDGGGTGIYENYELTSLIKQVPPINNSLFMFEIGAKSFHAFIGANFDRSAMVQWFHSPPKKFMKKNLRDMIDYRIKNGMPMFEQWKPDEKMWNYLNDNGV